MSHFAAKSIPHYFSQFEAFRSKHSALRWFVAESITIADFLYVPHRTALHCTALRRCLPERMAA